MIAEEYRTQPGDCATLVNLNADKVGELFWQVAAWTPQWKFLGVQSAYGQQIMPPPRLPNGEVLDGVPGQQMREHVYSRSRVMLMPSLYESWGRVAMEAFASGIPVIAHPTPGLVESLGEAGIFAYRDDLNRLDRRPDVPAGPGQLGPRLAAGRSPLHRTECHTRPRPVVRRHRIAGHEAHGRRRTQARHRHARRCGRDEPQVDGSAISVAVKPTPGTQPSCGPPAWTRP